MSQQTPPDPNQPDIFRPVPPPPPGYGAYPPPPPPTTPKPTAKQRTDGVRRLNRATAAAVSLTLVGTLALGTGIAVASSATGSSTTNDSLTDAPRSGQLLPRGDSDDSDDFSRLNPWSDDDDDDSDSNGSTGDGSAGGFQAGPPAGGTHGNSGSS